MKNSYSNIFTFNKKILSKTIKSLKNGGVVGLPTETVYGLGGNAYSKRAKLYTSIHAQPKCRPNSADTIIIDGAVIHLSFSLQQHIIRVVPWWLVPWYHWYQ